jgi:creatinine amidohydrolase
MNSSKRLRQIKLPEHVEIKWRFEELTNTGASGILVWVRRKNFIHEMDKNDWKYGLKG